MKHASALAALGAALSLAFAVPSANAAHFGGHGGHFGGGHFRGGNFRGGGWWGGPGIYLGDSYYDDDDYGYSCYWRHGRRFCRY